MTWPMRWVGDVACDVARLLPLRARGRRVKTEHGVCTSRGGVCGRVGWRLAVKFRILGLSDLLNTMAVLVL
ncbi:hypothetical protein TSUD_283940 [Trifolium subterraneum]|uniref:Uncharacterized protein n=1 Tax=Trifolium subterraneum TaxID=3900 RepID=A0A2Z6PHH9_TRISU|nr:hypothetical protein TSUD_283940 [Trifolium subterraneum]